MAKLKNEYSYVGKNTNIMCERFLDMFVNFNNKIDMNNYLINEKIRKKMNIINYLHKNGFSMLNFDDVNINNIVSRLDKLEAENGITTYNDEVNKLLGIILHNIYQYSGYQVLISNMPEYSIIRGKERKERLEKIDSIVIYDTMEAFSGNDTVNQVFQISNDAYLVQFINDFDANKVCNLLNNTVVGNNLIRVEYIPQIGGKIVENKEKNAYDHRNKFIKSMDFISEECNYSLPRRFFNLVNNIVSNVVSNVISNAYNSIKYGFVFTKYGK
jgi:hypothetical protein